MVDLSKFTSNKNILSKFVTNFVAKFCPFLPRTKSSQLATVYSQKNIVSHYSITFIPPIIIYYFSTYKMSLYSYPTLWDITFIIHLLQ